jgi:DMATS type aromatic prenyltransferase
MAKTSIMADPTHINQEVQASRQDQAFWWSALGQPLSTLLRTSRYNADDEKYYLRWLHDHIMPALGPRPVDGRPHCGSWLTHDGSSLEYSLNWKQNKDAQTVRLAIEPASRQSGTPADPLNQRAAGDVLESLARHVPGVDLARFRLFREATSVPDAAAADVRQKNPPELPLTSVWLAFDLERGQAMVAKAYYLPHLRAIWSGVSPRTIVLDAIRSCNGPSGSYDGAVALLDDYLGSFASAGAEAGQAPQVVLLSNDCVADSPSCRFKVYVQAAVSSLAHALDMFSLGGRLSGQATAEGLAAVRELWCHLFGLDSSDPQAADVVVMSAGRQLLCVYEMRPAQGPRDAPDIEVKLHIPSWRMGKTDAELGARLAAWFDRHGAHELAARYLRDLELAFPRHGIESGRSRGTHTCISITWTAKTGLYMTMYYTPKLPEFHFAGE